MHSICLLDRTSTRRLPPILALRSDAVGFRDSVRLRSSLSAYSWCIPSTHTFHFIKCTLRRIHLRHHHRIIYSHFNSVCKTMCENEAATAHTHTHRTEQTTKKRAYNQFFDTFFLSLSRLIILRLNHNDPRTLLMV